MEDKRRPPVQRVILYGPDPDAPRGPGGIAAHMRYVSDGMKARDEFDVTSIFTDWKPIETEVVPSVLRRVLAVGRSVIQLVSANAGPGTVVHVNSFLGVRALLRDTPVIAACDRLGIPVFLQLHGGRIENVKDRAIVKRVAERIFDTVDRIGIHPGPQWDDFEGRGWDEKMEPMYNVVPRSGKIADTRRDSSHFLFLGRVRSNKGVNEVIDAFQRLCVNERMNVRLTVAGDGPLLGQIRRRVVESPYREKISIEGFVKGAELETVMDRANVFVLPSSHQEGFPFAFLEAGERGMACIVTKNSAIPAIFEEEEEFLAVDVAENDSLYRAMAMMADDPERRSQLGSAIRCAVHRCCTVERSIQRFMKVYARLLEPGSGLSASVGPKECSPK